KGLYYRYSKKEQYLFSFFLMGIMIFFICSILKTVDIQLGMALGLFAIFAILRFRTVNFSVKEMTYIFTIIGIALINSQANVPPPILGAISINTIILVSVYVLERYLQRKVLSSHTLIYYKTDLLKPDMYKELLQDISSQTGFKVEKVVIRKVDTGKGNAEIEIFYRDKP
ncbi:MAG: DUF4956 domain-containing protein, partial [Bacteroidales bacterium]|nr:DUF4956 domain-containing protein [Bacteroidales bacterium]